MKKDILTVLRMHTIMSDYISDLEKQLEDHQKRLALCEQVIDEQTTMLHKFAVLLSRETVDKMMETKEVKDKAISAADLLADDNVVYIMRVDCDYKFVTEFYSRLNEKLEGSVLEEYHGKYGGNQDVRPKQIR